MGTQYGGLAANITQPGAIAIVSSTAANPTVIQATGHGLNSGDIVDIVGHQVNTRANGVDLVVTFIDSNHFSVPINSAAGSAGGSTGSVYPRVFVNNIATIPADGDPDAAATFMPPYATVLDRTNSLRSQTGPFKLVATGSLAGAANAYGTSWSGHTSCPASTVFSVVGTTPLVTIHNVSTSDIVIVQIDTTLEMSWAPPGPGGLEIEWTYAYTPVGTFATASPVVGSAKGYSFSATFSGGTTCTSLVQSVPLTLVAQFGIGTLNALALSSGSMGDLALTLSASGLGTAVGVDLTGDYNVSYNWWRANQNVLP